MSCGNAHETPCHDVLDALCAFLDNEETAVDRNLIAAHLSECSPCEQELLVDRIMKGLISRACCGEPAPEAVRVNIQAVITQIQVEITSRS